MEDFGWLNAIRLCLSLSLKSTLFWQVATCFVFYCIVFLVDVPFSLYKQFVIEERHGFNKMTFGLWLTDLAKTWLCLVLIFPYIPYPFLITSRMEIGLVVDPAGH